ncbi:MAG: hypothetical protein EGP73_05240 [Alistipes indistinctus]|nr:hypothetical protein [Alistipes indistinctus]MBD9134258.1 hypothetical protein [Alistipes indistinctus]
MFRIAFAGSGKFPTICPQFQYKILGYGAVSGNYCPGNVGYAGGFAGCRIPRASRPFFIRSLACFPAALPDVKKVTAYGSLQNFEHFRHKSFAPS